MPRDGYIPVHLKSDGARPNYYIRYSPSVVGLAYAVQRCRQINQMRYKSKSDLN
jgi:hypothetical protein